MVAQNHLRHPYAMPHCWQIPVRSAPNQPPWQGERVPNVKRKNK